MLNWRRDPGVERRIEDAKRRSLASEMRTKLLESEIEELDLKLRNFYELELRLKHGKPSRAPGAKPKAWAVWGCCNDDGGVRSPVSAG